MVAPATAKNTLHTQLSNLAHHCNELFDTPSASITPLLACSDQLEQTIVDYVYAPDTKETIAQQLPGFINHMETVYALSIRSAEKEKWEAVHERFSRLYQLLFEGNLSGYMPPQSVVPYSWLLSRQPWWQQQLENLSGYLQNKTDAMLQSLVLDAFAPLAQVQPHHTIIYQQVQYYERFLRALLQFTGEEAPAIDVVELLVQMDFNTYDFCQYYKQQHSQTWKALPDKTSRLNYVYTHRFQVNTARLSPFRASEHHRACIDRPPLTEILEPFFNFEIRFIETNGEVPDYQKLRIDDTPELCAWHIKKFAEDMGLFPRYSFKEVCEIVCMILHFTQAPTLKPATLASYTQPKYHKEEILGSLIHHQQLLLCNLKQLMADLKWKSR